MAIIVLLCSAWLALLANALGSTGTTLLRITQGYAEFVNGGTADPVLRQRLADAWIVITVSPFGM